MPSAGVWGTFGISRQVRKESSGEGKVRQDNPDWPWICNLLPQPPNCWDYSCAPPFLAKNKLLLKFNFLLITKITLRFPLKPPKSYWNMPDFLNCFHISYTPVLLQKNCCWYTQGITLSPKIRHTNYHILLQSSLLVSNTSLLGPSNSLTTAGTWHKRQLGPASALGNGLTSSKPSSLPRAQGWTWMVPKTLLGLRNSKSSRRDPKVFPLKK